MDLKQEILGIPQALRDTLEKGRAEYEALLRKTHWGEGPIYVVGCGSALASGLAAAYAFESLLGWPVVLRPPAAFRIYTLPGLRPRSAVWVISSPDALDETLEAARLARARGAVLLVLTHDPRDPLAEVADGVFLLRTGAEYGQGLRAMVCRHAAISLIALVAARTFKRHDRQADILNEQIDHLAERVEWVYTQLADAVRSFASELKKVRSVGVVGGGFYHPTALQAASLLKELAALPAEGIEASAFPRARLEGFGPEDGVLFLSGSRCRLKGEIHQAALRARKKGVIIFSVTDSNDGELARSSTFAVLLPMLSEMVGSTLTLALLGQLAYRAAVDRGHDLGGGASTKNVNAKRRKAGRDERWKADDETKRA